MNKVGSAAKVKLNSFDDLFGTEQPQAGIEQVQEIALSELHEFKGHPFKVLDDEKMQETVESVREHGVLMPGIARPRAEGGYEIIAGHRRRHACEAVGLETMPMFIRNYTDDEATIIMVDSNIQREDILPSEKAKAYRIDSIMEDLGCAKEKAVKVLAELDSVKGIGLVEKVRRGLGKPDIIYVKNFASITEQMDEKEPANADKITEVGKSNFKKSENRTSGSQKIKLQEVRKSNFRKSENQTSGSSEIEPQEVGESNPNYTNYNQTYMNQTNYNQTELSYTNPINQSVTEKPQADVMDAMDDAQSYIELIKENISYDHHMKYDGYGEKELYTIIQRLINMDNLEVLSHCLLLDDVWIENNLIGAKMYTIFKLGNSSQSTDFLL